MEGFTFRRSVGFTADRTRTPPDVGKWLAAMRIGTIESRSPIPFMEVNTEKLATIGLVLLIAYIALSGVVRAASKPLWFDELITVGLAQQPTLGNLRSALEHAADSHPPPFYVLERFAGRLPLNEHIAYRLPSILAFCCVFLCTFLFIRRARGGPLR